MSVWKSPCYNIEAPRNTVNNYPEAYLKTFPDELAGVFNFSFGDCEDFHPEYSTQHAATLFRSNPKIWKEFCSRTRTTSRSKEAYRFRATVRATNVQYSGIRAVYWAYKAITTGSIKLEGRLKEEILNKFTRKLWNFTSAGSRTNEEDWQAAGDALWSSTEEEGYKTPEWFEAESCANAFNFLWTANSTPSFKANRKKSRIIAKGAIRTEYYTRARPQASEGSIEEGYVPTIPKGHCRSEQSKYQYLANWVVAKAKAASRPELQDSRTIEARADAVASGEEELGESPSTTGRSYKDLDPNPTYSADGRREFSRRLLREVEVLPYIIVSKKTPSWKMFRFDGGYILYDELTNEAGIFYTKDHDRVAQMLKSRAQLIKYYSLYAVDDVSLNSIMVRKFKLLEELFIKQLNARDPDFCNWICRACDVTQFKYLASLASDMNEQALSDQNAKIKKENLDKYFPIDEAIRIIVGDEMGVKEELELFKFYKLFPCPDFCVYSSISKFKKKSEAPNKCSWEVTIKMPTGENYSTNKSEFHAYTMRNRLIMFKETHGYLPGYVIDPIEPDDRAPDYLGAYPDINPLLIRLEDMKWINFEGTFLYRRFDGSEEELVKDKSTAGKLQSDDRWSGNQVLEYLFRDDFLKQKEINDAFKENRVPNISKMEILLRFKAEAKKPDSRLFSMATDEQRRQLSELEANIATYAKNCRGSSQGKSDIDMNISLTAMATTISPVFEELLISFDLAAFSPKMSPELKEYMYSTWAYCFGEKDIENTRSIFTDNEVVMDLFGLDDRWKLEGNDLEGFNARMNTVMHAEIMGYCVYKLRQINLVAKNVSADLEALIDDGLLKLYFPRKQFKQRALYAVKLIEAIYFSIGLEISWDKTFVSQVMCQYLNRVFFDGTEVTPGVKAFMRIGKIEEMPVPSLTDDLEAIAASARGAIKSGTDHRLAYWAYIWEFTMALLKWSSYDWKALEGENLAFRCLFPVAFSGFGICTLYGLATNSSFNSTVACLSNLRMFVFGDHARTQLVNKVLNAGVREMDDEELLRSPTSIRTVYRTLNSRRFANAARKYVMSNSVNPFLKFVVRRLTATQEISMAEVIANLKVINEFQRSRLAKMDPMDFLEKIVKKLQNSGTAARMLGTAKVLALTMINRSEARTLIKESARGYFAPRASTAYYV